MFKNVTIRTVDGPVLMAGQLGRDFSNPYAQEWARLAELVGAPTNAPAIVYINKKAYLPKVYQTAGQPVLVWGAKTYPLVESPQLQVVYGTADTNGYKMQAHAIVMFSMTDESVEKSEAVAEVALPVATHFSKDSSADFLKLVKVRASEAFKTQVREPDPTAGLEYLDDLNLDVNELTVKVHGLIVRESQQYGNKYAIAAVEFEGQLFKVRCGRDVCSLAVMGLKFPHPVEGTVKKGKTFLNLLFMTLTEDNIAN